MFKYEEGKYYNAGENAFHRWGKKAQEKVKMYLSPKNGYYSFPVDGGKYWTIGTSKGKYGEFAKIGDTIFSVNSAGYMYAKEGSEKADLFIKSLHKLIETMQNEIASKAILYDDEEGE